MNKIGNIILETIPKLEELSLIEKNQFALFLLSVCEIELISISIYPNQKSYSHIPFFINNDGYVSIYFNITHEQLWFFIEKHGFHKEYPELIQTLELFTEVISFVEQLPFENLLEDTLERHTELLQKMHDIRKILVENF